MSKRLGNYKFRYCNKHGKYAIVSNEKRGCPKCRAEIKSKNNKQ